MLAGHYHSAITFQITKLGRHPAIISNDWLACHGAVLDPSTSGIEWKKGWCPRPEKLPIVRAPSLTVTDALPLANPQRIDDSIAKGTTVSKPSSAPLRLQAISVTPKIEILKRCKPETPIQCEPTTRPEPQQHTQPAAEHNPTPKSPKRSRTSRRKNNAAYTATINSISLALQEEANQL